MTDLNQRVTEVTFGLSRLSREGFDIADLVRIWAKIPDGNIENEDTNYLATECIREISQLVDAQFAGLPKGAKTAKKLRLMAGLLELKATQVESLN